MSFLKKWILYFVPITLYFVVPYDPVGKVWKIFDAIIIGSISKFKIWIIFQLFLTWSVDLPKIAYFQFGIVLNSQLDLEYFLTMMLKTALSYGPYHMAHMTRDPISAKKSLKALLFKYQFCWNFAKRSLVSEKSSAIAGNYEIRLISGLMFHFRFRFAFIYLVI